MGEGQPLCSEVRVVCGPGFRGPSWHPSSFPGSQKGLLIDRAWSHGGSALGAIVPGAHAQEQIRLSGRLSLGPPHCLHQRCVSGDRREQGPLPASLGRLTSPASPGSLEPFFSYVFLNCPESCPQTVPEPDLHGLSPAGSLAREAGGVTSETEDSPAQTCPPAARKHEQAPRRDTPSESSGLRLQPRPLTLISDPRS